MGSKAGMLAEGRKLIGIHEHPMGSNYAPPITPWYGLGNVSWCDESVSYAAYKSDNLAAVGGKFAYVPAHMQWARSRGILHFDTSNIPAGAVVGFRWDGRKNTTVCDHIGICERNLGDGTYYFLEGNSDDQYRRTHRDRKYIACWFMPLYNSTTASEDDVPIRTSLGLTEAQSLKWDEFVVLDWTDEYADPKGAHAKGTYPGYVAPVSSWIDARASVRVTGLAEGDSWQVEYQVHDWKDGKSTGDPWSEIEADQHATSGDQYVTGAVSKGVKKGQHVYLAVKVIPAGGDAKGRPAPKAVGGRWTIAQDNA